MLVIELRRRRWSECTTTTKLPPYMWVAGWLTEWVEGITLKLSVQFSLPPLPPPPPPTTPRVVRGWINSSCYCARGPICPVTIIYDISLIRWSDTRGRTLYVRSCDHRLTEFNLFTWHRQESDPQLLIEFCSSWASDGLSGDMLQDINTAVYLHHHHHQQQLHGDVLHLFGSRQPNITLVLCLNLMAADANV